MLSLNQIKFLKSLQQKKYRQQSQQFIVEGDKMVKELLASKLETLHLYHTQDFNLDVDLNGTETTSINEKELQKISSLKTPNKALATVKMPQYNDKLSLQNDYSLVLDNIQDPGNMGTIIRTADWFGIRTIYCSNETVDCFNPKVVQATMGSIFRLNIIYLNLEELFTAAQKQGVAIIGAALDGKNMYHDILPKNALLVMGNESKGISSFTKSQINHSIRIPSFPENANVESLNVSIATALICGELRRQNY